MYPKKMENKDLLKPSKKLPKEYYQQLFQNSLKLEAIKVTLKENE